MNYLKRKIRRALLNQVNRRLNRLERTAGFKYNKYSYLTK